jgi:DNA-binding NarL/FixJ family response regulator
MILLIDDDPSFATDIAAHLRPRSDFVWTNRSDIGLWLIMEKQPGQILLDLNLPHRLAVLDEEEGLEVVRRLAPSARGRVVIVTGAMSASMRQQLQGLGVERIYLKTEPMTRLRGLVEDGMEAAERP